MDGVFKHILVATDGSRFADKAVELALRIACGARVTALLVAYDYGLADYVRAAVSHRPDAQELREEILAEGRRTLEEVIARVADGAPFMERCVVLCDGAPCHEIVAKAQRDGCDLIVMASQGLGGKLPGVVGSQTLAVLSSATVPVLVAR